MMKFYSDRCRNKTVTKVLCSKHNSPSSSTIVTTVIQCGCTNTLLGRVDGSTIRMNDSFASNTLSACIETLTVILISPAGITTFNGPLS